MSLNTSGVLTSESKECSRPCYLKLERCDDDRIRSEPQNFSCASEKNGILTAEVEQIAPISDLCLSQFLFWTELTWFRQPKSGIYTTFLAGQILQNVLTEQVLGRMFFSWNRVVRWKCQAVTAAVNNSLVCSCCFSYEKRKEDFWKHRQTCQCFGEIHFLTSIHIHAAKIKKIKVSMGERHRERQRERNRRNSFVLSTQI